MGLLKGNSTERYSPNYHRIERDHLQGITSICSKVTKAVIDSVKKRAQEVTKAVIDSVESIGAYNHSA